VLRPITTFTKLAIRDCLRKQRGHAADDEDHLLEAEAWLCRAQDVSGDGGISYGYSIRGGWRCSYAETSGYIASTFYRLARRRGCEYAKRADRVLRWLLTVQNTDGSFANPRYGPQGIVFDTGQVLFGLVRGYEMTGDSEFLESARRAAAWMCEVADDNLRWTRNEHLRTPHVYNTRSAWALLLFNQLESDATREATARSNLEWALGVQRPSGFFDQCAFVPGRAPFTHTIAYTAQGLLESGLLLKDHRFVDAAVHCARSTLGHLRHDGFLPSTISIDGEQVSSSSCLTGNCQFSVIWAQLYALGEGDCYRKAIFRALDYVIATQDITTSDLNVRGGIKGSQPIWGRYAFMSFPNWATKFFIDAMWLRKELEK
jgi:hypothetical protein